MKARPVDVRNPCDGRPRRFTSRCVVLPPRRAIDSGSRRTATLASRWLDPARWPGSDGTRCVRFGRNGSRGSVGDRAAGAALAPSPESSGIGPLDGTPAPRAGTWPRFAAGGARRRGGFGGSNGDCDEPGPTPRKLDSSLTARSSSSSTSTLSSAVSPCVPLPGTPDPRRAGTRSAGRSSAPVGRPLAPRHAATAGKESLARTLPLGPGPPPSP